MQLSLELESPKKNVVAPAKGVIGTIQKLLQNGYSVLTFKQFIVEREKARTATTSDPLISTFKFTNIDRNHDYGTKLLMSNTSDLAMALHYRLYGSPRDYFTAVPRTISARAYQTPRMVKGQTPYALAKVAGNYVHKNLTVSMFEGLQIREAADVLIEAIMKATGNNIMYVFHCNEAAKDIAAMMPSVVNPKSECYIGRGAVYGLNAIAGRYPKTIPLRGKGTIKWTLDNADKIYDLMHDEWTFCDIEHSLCEYGKYLRLIKFGKGAKQRKEMK